jgi:hypothetical protein
MNGSGKLSDLEYVIKWDEGGAHGIRMVRCADLVTCFKAEYIVTIRGPLVS